MDISTSSCSAPDHQDGGRELNSPPRLHFPQPENRTCVHGPKRNLGQKDSLEGGLAAIAAGVFRFDVIADVASARRKIAGEQMCGD